MLFHVTMTHTPENCPDYDLERTLPKLLTTWEKRDELAKQFKVKVHSYVHEASEHRDFALIDADSPSAVGMFLVQLSPSFRQDFGVTTVEHPHELLKKIKTMMAKK